MNGTRKQLPEVPHAASVFFISRSSWPARDGRSRITELAAISVIVLIGVILLGHSWWQPSADELVRDGFVALVEQRASEALLMAERAQRRDPHLVDAFRLGAEAAAVQQDFETAVRWQQGLIEHEGVEQLSAANWKQADWLLMKLHRPSDAEPYFRAALPLASAIGMKREFASMLGMCGRVFEANQLRVECLRAGDVRDVDLILLGLGDTASENTEFLKVIAERSSQDPLVQLGLARVAYQSHDLAQAERLLRDAIRRRPNLYDGHALLGLVLLESDSVDRETNWSAWLSGLDLSAHSHPGIWYVRGEMAERQGLTAAACRCFWEVIRRDAAHQRAHYRLGQLLPGINRVEAGRAFAERAADLQQLLLAVKAFNLSRDLAAVKQVVPLCVKCGLHWEARSWAAIGQALGGQPQSLRFNPSSSRVTATHDLSQRWPLDDLPLPDLKVGSVGTSVVAANLDRHESAAIRFVNDASAAHLDFRFMSGDDLQQPGMRMFEFTGGGIGVLDFDVDGWPDVWLTQGGIWPLDSRGERPLDRFFRNNGQGQFDDVTAAAAINEDRYSQGLAVGDVDQDGFPDVYVANFGCDRLFLNQGDGTFRDATDVAGLRDDDWSTSCVFADLNGDSLPDCYVVNYLNGPDLATRVCRNADGRIRACTPHEFPAASDRLLLNQGDGTFAEIAQAAGIDDVNGKGLGVVALDADGSGRLSVFVANDTTGNFLWSPREDFTPSNPHYFDRALLAGVGFDRDGRSQACMGVAAGDSNNDGLIDVLVTNYYDESNTLFRQTSSGLFEDVTARIGLREPSLKQLGFGTQFIDADRDGWLDLVVLNGHVDDETYRGIPFQMKPQFFQNNGAGLFVERKAESCGEWFTRPALGRALVRCDWNRDGRDDFIAGDRDEPVALLTNHTPSRGASLCVKLIGIRSNRDAIGATMRATVGSHEFVRQLTAGDGFQCSNDRRMVLSVGVAEIVQSLTIRWPSGETQTWRDVPTNRNFIAVEGGRLNEEPPRETACD